MGRLLKNVRNGAAIGATIGGAIDTLVIGGSTLIGGPVGFAAATTVVASKAAVGTLVGAGVGVAKTIKEELEKKPIKTY